MSWSKIYHESYKDLFKLFRKIKGFAVAFNTNLDAIIEFSPAHILELIDKIGIDSLDLYKKVIKWKGRIDDPVDFVAGLCGCFEKGKVVQFRCAKI